MGLGQKVQHALSFIFRADDQRRSLMKRGGHFFEDALGSIAGNTASLLRQEGHGVGFVHQAELAFGLLGGGRIEKDAAPKQGSMKIGHQ